MTPSHYEIPGFIFEDIEVLPDMAASTIRNLIQKDKDAIVYNMCVDNPRVDTDVIYYLEKCNIPYTGPTEAQYSQTKQEFKMLYDMYGVSTPSYVFAFNEDEI